MYTINKQYTCQFSYIAFQSLRYRLHRSLLPLVSRKEKQTKLSKFGQVGSCWGINPHFIDQGSWKITNPNNALLKGKSTQNYLTIFDPPKMDQNGFHQMTICIVWSPQLGNDIIDACWCQLQTFTTYQTTKWYFMKQTHSPNLSVKMHTTYQ